MLKFSCKLTIGVRRENFKHHMKGWEKMKKVIALLLAFVLVLSMASCTIEVHNYSGAGGENTGGTNSGSTGGTGGGSNAPAASSGTVKLYNGKIEIDPALQNLAKAYEAETGVHVEVESLGGGVDLQATLKQYYQGGNMPDIFVCEGAEDFKNWTGMLADLKDEAWTQDTEAEFVDADGLTIGFPYTTEAIGLAYNKSILEQAGVDPASITGPESMRAAFEAIDAKKEELGLTAVVGYCAESANLYWSSAQHVFGNYLDAGLDRDDTTYIDMLMGEGHKLDETRFTHFAEMLALFHEFSDPTLLVSGTYDQQVMNFAAGKYAFVTQGSWIGASMKEAYKKEYEAAGNFECGYVPYAFEEDIDTILTNSPSWWGVYKDGNVDGAKAFLQWVSTDAGQKFLVEEGGCVSPFASCTLVADDPFAPAIAEYTAVGKTSSWHWLDQPGNLAQDYTGIIFMDYAAGKLDTAGYVSTMQQAIVSCFNALGS